MKNQISLITLLFSIASFIGWAQTQVGPDIDGLNTNERLGKSVTLSANGNRIAVGLGADNRGQVRVLNYNGSNWVQMGADINGEAELDQIGYHVAMSHNGSRLIIGAPLNDALGNNTGHARVYEWIDDQWQQIGQDLDGEQAVDRMGEDVSISADGSIIAVGAHAGTGLEDDSGYAKVYEWDGDSWELKGSKLNGSVFIDHFGFKVKLNDAGDRIAVGAYGAGSPRTGVVYVYEWDGNDWQLMGTPVSGIEDGERFGVSLAFSALGDHFIAGAPLNDTNGNDSGVARIFRWSGTNWQQMGNTIVSEGFGDVNGASVAMAQHGEVIAIGAPGNSTIFNESGRVRIFQWNGSAWVQMGAGISGEGSDDNSGGTISLSKQGQRLAIGAEFNDEAGPGYGHARVFGLSDILSLEDVSNLQPYQIVPNPSHGSLGIHGIDRAQITLWDSSGRQLIKTIYEGSSLNMEVPVGVYFVQVENEDGKSVIKKWIVTD
ncbi:MAG: T9SS type A sorting domain-containing protein [Flavobacteriaceae bacterium]|nr:T9SS type A sorting domain-containing protein [Flavobacteriaceae bacterium]